MTEFDSVQSNLLLNADPVPEALLDASSLNTVLTMLELIDSAEELALLETLTLAQKRQIWDATPEATRFRLKQLRATEQSEDTSALKPPPEDEEDETDSPHLIDTSELLDDDLLNQIEETAATHLEAQLGEINLMLQEPLNLSARPTVAVGDWIVLQAKPKLLRAELIVIWEVIEVQGNYAHIFAEGLGTRIYPAAWMVIYPKPIGYIEPEF